MTQTSTLGLESLDATGRSLLFTDARTANTFADRPVSDSELSAIWDLAKWPPTAANTQPLRVVYVRTESARGKLVAAMADGNKAKTASAPVVAILAYDTSFHEHIPTVFPIRPEMREHFTGQPELAETHAKFNATLQAGYFLLAVRAQGLAAGPMAGYDGDAVDAAFFPDGRLKTLLVVNIGQPAENAWFPRLPRLDDEDVLSWA